MSRSTYTHDITKGLSSSLSKTDIGTDVVRFTIDTNQMFIDVNGERKEITDFVKDYTEEEIKAIVSPLPKFYYAHDTNKLFYYNVLSGWVSIAAEYPVTGVKGSAESSYRTGNVSIDKSNIGLSKVENKNSADIRSEITSKNITDALGFTPINNATKGSNNGIAELDVNGKVPSSQLPSYVDDVIDGYYDSGKFYKEETHTTSITGESGKIYIDLKSNKTYRWTGSTFGVISETIALGETSSTAYRGDRGKTAYDHSQATHARTDATKVEASTTNGNIKINGTETTIYTHPTGTNPHGTTKSDVGLSNVTNNKQIKGLSTGTTENHVIVFGADGYTVKDSGFTIDKSVPSDAKFSDTTYSTFVKSGADAKAGLVPAPSTTAGTSKYLREDGTWQTPPNTTYTPQKLGIGYGTCTTAEATTAKVVTLSNYELVTNGLVAVKFTYKVPANSTLNINSKGAKPIYRNGAAITANKINAGDTAIFVYNGTQYELISTSSYGTQDSDTKNTAGSTDTSSKIFLVGATSQAANPQTYSDNEIYATNGVLTTKSVQVGGTATTMQYDSTNKCIKFVFN